MGYRKLGMDSSHRRAILRNMVTSLIKEERIETTEAKAKEVRRIADKMITLGKKGDLAARKRALSYMTEEAVVAKLFDSLAPKFSERKGGYTRIIKKGHRRGDATLMVILELVD